MSALLGAFREAVLDEPELTGVAARLDRRLVVDSSREGETELFATALLVEFPAGPGRGCGVRVLSCGHPRRCWWRRRGCGRSWWSRGRRSGWARRSRRPHRR
ncbi:serine/threonine-protein phosphatase [Streptomyces somaliensis]|nr:serine/threonine-protein phosphatase [Streptomyces somaliensis]